MAVVFSYCSFSVGASSIICAAEFSAVHLSLHAFLSRAILGCFYCWIHENTGDIRRPIIIRSGFSIIAFLNSGIL